MQNLMLADSKENPYHMLFDSHLKQANRRVCNHRRLNIGSTKAHRICKQEISSMNKTTFTHSLWNNLFFCFVYIFPTFVGVSYFYPVYSVWIIRKELLDRSG